MMKRIIVHKLKQIDWEFIYFCCCLCLFISSYSVGWSDSRAHTGKNCCCWCFHMIPGKITSTHMFFPCIAIFSHAKSDNIAHIIQYANDTLFHQCKKCKPHISRERLEHICILCKFFRRIVESDPAIVMPML